MFHETIQILGALNETVENVIEGIEKLDALNNTVESNGLDIKLLKFSIGNTLFKLDDLDENISEYTILLRKYFGKRVRAINIFDKYLHTY